MRGDLPRSISLSDTGKPEIPPERFSSATEVRSLCAQMLRADRPRSWMRTKVDALVNGFPMYPKSLTLAKGMGWFPRTNFREMEGLIATQQTPIYDLMTETPQCIDIDLDIDAASNQERDDWENTIQEAFTWLMFKRWRTSFNFHMPLALREMLVHGLGHQVWPNESWVERTPRSGQIFFPEGVSLDFEQDGKYFMLRDFVPGEDVYQFIRHEEEATKKGWFPDNVWKTLANASKQNQKTTPEDLGELQRKTRRGDLGYWATSQTGLWLNWMFVKEYEGGISLYCIEENISAGNKDKGYLYKKRFQFDEWPLTMFPYDIGDGDLHSIQGLGLRTKDFYELSNRINNAMAVQVLISAFPMVSQTQPTIDPDKSALMRLGAMARIPYGLKPEIMQFPSLNNTGLALQKHFGDTLASNNQSAIAGGTPEPKDRETKFSFMLRSHDSARVSNGMQSLFESNLRDYYEKKYRRLIRTPKGDLPWQQMAEAFRRRCLKPPPGFRPVPPQALTEKALAELRERTSTGAGSAAVRLQAIQLIMNSPVYANAPEKIKVVIERALVAASLGGPAVNLFSRSVDDAQMPDQDESFATQENNGLMQGGDATIGDGQNDVTHARTHLAKAAELMQSCEQGQLDPQQCLASLRKLLEHAGQHLAKLQNNQARQAEFKDLADQWREIARYMNQLQSEVQQSQGEPSPEQQLSEKGMIDMHKADMDAQIKNQKAQGNEARAWRKLAFSERIKDVQTAAHINRQRATATK